MVKSFVMCAGMSSSPWVLWLVFHGSPFSTSLLRLLCIRALGCISLRSAHTHNLSHEIIQFLNPSHEAVERFQTSQSLTSTTLSNSCLLLNLKGSQAPRRFNASPSSHLRPEVFTSIRISAYLGTVDRAAIASCMEKAGIYWYDDVLWLGQSDFRSAEHCTRFVLSKQISYTSARIERRSEALKCCSSAEYFNLSKHAFVKDEVHHRFFI